MLTLHFVDKECNILKIPQEVCKIEGIYKYNEAELKSLIIHNRIKDIKSWFYGAKVRKRNCSSKFSRAIFEMITLFSVWNAF
jgi:hypothetical protein